MGRIEIAIEALTESPTPSCRCPRVVAVESMRFGEQDVTELAATSAQLSGQLRYWLSSSEALVGYGIAYDLACIVKQFPSMLAPVFAKYARDEVFCARMGAIDNDPNGVATRDAVLKRHALVGERVQATAAIWSRQCLETRKTVNGEVEFRARVADLAREQFCRWLIETVSKDLYVRSVEPEFFRLKSCRSAPKLFELSQRVIAGQNDDPLRLIRLLSQASHGTALMVLVEAQRGSMPSWAPQLDALGWTVSKAQSV